MKSKGSKQPRVTYGRVARYTSTEATIKDLGRLAKKQADEKEKNHETSEPRNPRR
jgi:hypothetical protein